MILKSNEMVNGRDEYGWLFLSFGNTNTNTFGTCTARLGANLVILAQIHYNLSGGQVKFPRILSENDQIAMTPIFNASREYPKVHV